MNFIKKHKYWFMLLPIIAITAILISLYIIPNDYWWHIKAGEYMVTNKTIPFTDVFSWIGVEKGFYWHSHEWLTEVVLYILFKCVGEVSGYIFVFILALVLVILLYYFNKEGYLKNKILAIIWVGIGAVLLMYVSSPRPHMISFILLTLTIYLLYYYKENEKSKRIWFLPLISLLWVNFHGGSSNLPYVLSLIFVATGLFDFELGKIEFKKLSKKQIKTYLSVALLSFIVLVINPHGIDMITYPYSNMGDSFMLFNISEWRSPDLKIASDIIYYISMAVPVMLFVVSKRKINFTDLTLALAFIYLTSKSIRFSVLLYIVSSFFIFKYMNDVKFKFIEKFPFKDFIYKLTIAISIAIIIIVPLTIITSNTVSTLFKAPISEEIITYISENKPERLYNSYNSGGYLIYKDIPVFVDGRADLYSAGGTLKDAMGLDDMSVNVEEVISKYNFDMFLLKKDTPLIQYLEKYNEFEKVLEDNKYVLFDEIK